MLFEHDVHGGLVVDADGGFVLAKVKRRDLKRRGLGLPDFHALRHGAAMDCEDAEEARDLLRHKNSNVTRAVYRAHFGDRRRELLRARLEARLEASDPDGAHSAGRREPAEVTDLQAKRGSA